MSLAGLDQDALVKILKEPKNALLKQYQKLLYYDNASLEFTDDAVKAVAQKALELKTGARGLRSVLEAMMLDIMYEVPSEGNIEKVIIGKDTVLKGKKPKYVYLEEKPSA